MKTIISIACILLFSIAANGQNNTDLTGKWKIVSFNVGIYHNYKTDSTSIPKELQESLKGNSDSLLSISLITGIVQEFGNYYYIFLANRQFQETKDGIIKQEGSYVIDNAKQQITLIVKDKFGGENRQILNFRMKGETLEFKVPSEDMDMVFDLEKSE